MQNELFGGPEKGGKFFYLSKRLYLCTLLIVK